jgi:phosphatidate cytidylyltransferase
LSGLSGFGANLLQRVATALVAIPLLLAALFLGPPLLPVAIVAAAVIQGMRELLRLLETAGARPLRLPGWIAMAAFFVEAASPQSGVPLWLIAPLVVGVGALGTRADHAKAALGAGATLLAAAYLGGMGGAIAGLVVLSPVEQGAWRVVLLLATIMSADAAAFFVGHALGRHPLAPRLSPSKTVEGALGALAGGCAGALAVGALGLRELPAAHALGLGALVAASGIAGDLFESLLKRWAGAKDSGALFPGHGGMLDRLDSLLFGAPVVYWYFLIFH